MATNYRLYGFGEAMIRYAPMNLSTDEPDREAFLRSTGGDELNVCVDMAILNSEDAAAPVPEWVSVLPKGPMGDVVAQCATRANVGLSHTPRVDGEMGTFYVLPELKTVHYQRRNSTFAKQSPFSFDWNKILETSSDGVKPWLHMTGITPMISEPPRLSWTMALHAAAEKGIPVTMDFNHRKQLGPLEELWAVMLPQLPRLELLILSVGSLVELAVLNKFEDLVPGSDIPLADPSWRVFVAKMRKAWGLKRLAVCFKTRDDSGLQRRWSAIADAAGVHTTEKLPIFHRPKDECGGGSAWAAGIIDSFWKGGLNATESEDPTKDIFDSPMVNALRHADLNAAMCQEVIGDMTKTTRSQLMAVEEAGKGKEIDLTTEAPLASEIDATVDALKNCGILGIIRAKNTEAAIARGLELVDMGLKAIEVTLDTADWRRVLKELASKTPPDVCVGVGTVMDDTVCCLKEIKELGGKFALSPINPTGLIPECQKLGLVAVPSGLSSNEMWEMHRRGAKIIKMFHAGQVTAKILKSMMGVSPLRAMNIMPSGGVSPDNAKEWLDAGAYIVGMGSNLVGKDINFPTGSDEYNAGKAAWEESGKAKAQVLFDEMLARYSK